VYLPEVVGNFIARLVNATHPGESAAAAGVRFGASPRAALALAAAARGRAFLSGRINASFEDVQALARPVLQHRLVLDYRARVAGRSAADVVAAVLEEVAPTGSPLPASILAAKV
jgi:MoxR-like ATPase